VCNKTIEKYLAAFGNSLTLDWEIYVPALMFAYNTSFHCSSKATPFSLMCGLEAQLPSIFMPDFYHLHGPNLGDNNLRPIKKQSLTKEYQEVDIQNG
jgi:hypothetical protein